MHMSFFTTHYFFLEALKGSFPKLFTSVVKCNKLLKLRLLAMLEGGNCGVNTTQKDVFKPKLAKLFQIT